MGRGWSGNQPRYVQVRGFGGSMFQYPSREELASVGLTKEEFLARYVNCQRVKIGEPIERFTDRVLTRFYLDYPQILKNPEPSFTRADEQALLAEAEYFNGVTNGDAP